MNKVKFDPLVSIVLPTYKGSRFIGASIESCVKQTYRNIELIVVDGGSTDGTLDIVRNFSDSRIKLVTQPDNIGRLPGALNVGFAHASGEYWTWTQDDDYYGPDAIEVLSSYLESHPDVGLVYAGYWGIDAEGQVTHEATLGPPEALFWTNPVGPCFLYRRGVAEKIGEYDVAYRMAEDVNYWMRVYRCAKMAWIPECHYYHRSHRGSLTLREYGGYRALRVAAKSRRQVLGLGWIPYQRQVAAAFIEEGFAAYSDRALDRVRSCFAQGLLRNPGWLANRGVLSIGIESLLGSHVMTALRRRSKTRLSNP